MGDFPLPMTLIELEKSVGGNNNKFGRAFLKKIQLIN